MIENIERNELFWLYVSQKYKLTENFNLFKTMNNTKLIQYKNFFGSQILIHVSQETGKFEFFLDVSHFKNRQILRVFFEKY